MQEKDQTTLVGIWIPCINRIPNDPAWPRLVLTPDGRGLFEQGDYPAIFAVDHFKWRVVGLRTLEITQHRVEELSSDWKSTEWADDEPDLVDNLYDFNLQLWPEGLILETTFVLLFSYRAYMKTSELVSETYQPSWRFV